MNYIVQNLKSNRGEVKSSTVMWVCIAVILVVVVTFIAISAWPDSNADDPLDDFNAANQDASQQQNNNNNSGITAGGGGAGAVNGAGGNNTNNNTNNSKDFIKFTINDQEYQARPETTWREWVSTPHNVGGFYMAATDAWYICDANGAPIIGIDPNEVIMDKTAYHTVGYISPIIP